MAPAAPITALEPALVQRIQASYPGLEWLDLSDNQIARVQHLQVLPSLRGLSLVRNRLTECSLPDLAPLRCLEEVDLSGNAIQLVRALAPGQAAPPIRELNLADNAIQQPGALLSLACLSGSLETLTLAGNPLASTPDYRGTVARLFPWLRRLDGVELGRTNEVATPVVAPTAPPLPSPPPPPPPPPPPQVVPPEREATGDETARLEAARVALRREREAMKKERDLVIEVLQRLEQQQQQQQQQQEQPTANTVEACVGTDTPAVHERPTQTADGPRLAEASTDTGAPADTSSRETQVSLAQSSETQTQTPRASAGAQTEQPALPETRPGSTQTVPPARSDAVAQTAVDLAALERLEARATAAEAAHSSAVAEADALRDDLAQRANENAALREQAEQTAARLRSLKEATRRTDRASRREDVDLKARGEALERLVVAQERAIVGAAGKDGVCDLAEVLAAWRGKAFELMVQLESAKLVAKADARTAARERLDLLGELEGAERRVAALEQERNTESAKRRALALEARQLRAALQRASAEANAAMREMHRGAEALAADFEQVEARSQARLDRLGHALTRTEARCRALLAALPKQAAALRAARAREADLCERLEEGQQELHARAEALRAADAETGRLAKAQAELAERASSLERELSESRAAAERDKREALASAAADHRAAAAGLEAEVAQARRELGVAQARQRETERELLERLSRLERQQASQLASLEERLARRESQADNLRKERNALLGTLREAEKRGLLPGFGLVPPAGGAKSTGPDKAKAAPARQRPPPPPPPRPRQRAVQAPEQEPATAAQEADSDDAMAQVLQALGGRGNAQALLDEEEEGEEEEDSEANEDEVLELLLQAAVSAS